MSFGDSIICVNSVTLPSILDLRFRKRTMSGSKLEESSIPWPSH